MATLDLSTVELVSTLRAAPQNGSPSSQDYNDSWTESLADLASLAGFIDNIVIPLFNGLSSTILPNPQGSPLGLEGKYIFGDTADVTPLFFDNLSNESLSLADSLRVIQGLVQTSQVGIAALNVEVTALQTALSSTNQNDVAQALQNFAAAIQSLQAQVVAINQQLQALLIHFQISGVENDVQNTLNFIPGANITIVNPTATAEVVIAAVLPPFKTNGTNNADQSALNLKAGANVTLTQTGPDVTIAATGTAGTPVEFETNGSDNSTQTLLNLTGAGGTTLHESGGTVTVTSLTDGVDHGDALAAMDPGFLVLRDDFNGGSGANFQIGELGWQATGSVPISSVRGGKFPYAGRAVILNSGSAADYATLALPGIVQSGSGIGDYYMPLLDCPGWKASFVFNWLPGSAYAGLAGTPPVNKSFYVGFAATYSPLAGLQWGGPRPGVFYGLRYDTDPGPQNVVTSVTMSGATAVYAGTSILNGAADFYVGATIVITGFSNSTNNGTFVVTASSTTSLSVTNVAGVNETGATGLAAGPSIGDSTFVYEVVANPINNSNAGLRNNQQGLTQALPFAPTVGQWIRLDLECLAAGQLTMSINGANSHTFTVPQYTAGGASSNGSASVKSNQARVDIGPHVATNQGDTVVFSAGSQVTVGTFGAGFTGLNGTFVLEQMMSVGPDIHYPVVNADQTNTSITNLTAVGYASGAPYLAYGNDTAGAAGGNGIYDIHFDFFGMLWTQALAGGGAPDPTKARYF